MIAFHIGTGAALGGWIGWWLGARFNGGWAFLFGSVGFIAGAFIGWGMAQKCF
jgi:hypothetical protein